MAFGVFHSKLAAAVGCVLKRAEDRGSRSYGAGMDRIGVWDDEVNATGLNAVDILRRLEAAAVLVVLFAASSAWPMVPVSPS